MNAYDFQLQISPTSLIGGAEPKQLHQFVCRTFELRYLYPDESEEAARL